MLNLKLNLLSLDHYLASLKENIVAASREKAEAGKSKDVTSDEGQDIYPYGSRLVVELIQ